MPDLTDDKGERHAVLLSVALSHSDDARPLPRAGHAVVRHGHLKLGFRRPLPLFPSARSQPSRSNQSHALVPVRTAQGRAASVCRNALRAPRRRAHLRAGGEKCKFAVPEKALKVFRRLLQSRRSPLKPRRRVDPVLRDALVVSPSSFATPVDARLRRRRRAERRARWRRRDSGCCCFPTAPLTPTVHMSHAPVNGTGHDE